MWERSLPFPLPLLSDKGNVIFVLSVYCLFSLSEVGGLLLAGRMKGRVDQHERLGRRDEETEAVTCLGKGGVWGGWGTRGSRTIPWYDELETQGKGTLWAVWGGYDWDLLLSNFHHFFLGRLCFF